jgi:hypothetical protein
MMQEGIAWKKVFIFNSMMRVEVLALQMLLNRWVLL